MTRCGLVFLSSLSKPGHPHCGIAPSVNVTCLTVEVTHGGCRLSHLAIPQVENKGVEPLIPGCKPGVFPLALIPQVTILVEPTSQLALRSRLAGTFKLLRSGLMSAHDWTRTSTRKPLLGSQPSSSTYSDTRACKMTKQRGFQPAPHPKTCAFPSSH